MELCCGIKLRIDIYTIRHRLAHHWGVWAVSLNLTTNMKRIVQNIDLNCRALIELFSHNPQGPAKALFFRNFLRGSVTIEKFPVKNTNHF